MDDASRKFFSSANAHVGPAGSATRLIATALLNRAGSVDLSRFQFGSFKEQREWLVGGRADVGFMLAGPMQDTIREMIEQSDHDLDLVSIDSALSSTLRRSDDIALDPTTLTELSLPHIESLGNPALLIASLDIPDEHLAAIVEQLVTAQTKYVNAQHGLDRSFANARQFDQKRVRKSLLERVDAQNRELLAALFQCVSTTLAVSLLIVWWGSWLLSHLFRVRKFIKGYSELHARHVEVESQIWYPEKHEAALEKLAGLRELVGRHLAQIETAFVEGSLFARHHEGLVALFEGLSGRLKRSCQVHLSELRRRNGATASQPVLFDWVLKGHLDLTDYERVSQPAEPETPHHTEDSPRRAAQTSASEYD